MEETGTKTMHEIVAEKMQQIREDILDGLHPDVKKFITSAAAETSTPVEAGLACAIGVAAAALGDKVRTHYKNYINHGSAYVVLIGDSGNGKSPLLGLFIRPLKEANAEIHDTYQQELAAWRQGGKKTDRPILRRLIAVSPTMEGLAKDIRHNPHGIIIFRDEGVLDFLGAYKDREGSNRDDADFLRLWGYDGIDRSRATEIDYDDYSKSSCVSLLGGTQPVELSKLFGDRRIRRGMFGRFLFNLMPPRPPRPVIAPPPADCAPWCDLITELLRMQPIELEYVPDALAEVESFLRLTDGLAADADEYTRTVYYKMQVQIFRIGIILHYLGKSRHSPVITLPEVMYAERVCKMFFQQSEAALKTIQEEMRATAPVPTEAACIKRLFQLHPQMKKADFARLLGVKRQLVSKCAQ